MCICLMWASVPEGRAFGSQGTHWSPTRSISYTCHTTDCIYLLEQGMLLFKAWPQWLTSLSLPGSLSSFWRRRLVKLPGEKHSVEKHSVEKHSGVTEVTLLLLTTRTGRVEHRSEGSTKDPGERFLNTSHIIQSLSPYDPRGPSGV